MDIAQVIAACQRNNPEAQRSLFELVSPHVFRIAMRYVRSRMDAEDIVQNTCIRIFRKLDQFDPSKSKFITWASRIAINESLRLLRQRRPLLFTEGDEYKYERVDTEPLPIDHLTAADLRKTILKLPEGYRAVFNLFEIEGFTHLEIGELLGVSPATSRSQLVRAKRILRKWLVTVNQVNHPKIQFRE